jgi:hypothetical protein
MIMASTATARMAAITEPGSYAPEYSGDPAQLTSALVANQLHHKAELDLAASTTTLLSMYCFAVKLKVSNPLEYCVLLKQIASFEQGHPKVKTQTLAFIEGNHQLNTSEMKAFLASR